MMEWTTEKPKTNGTYWIFDGRSVKSVVVSFYGKSDYELFGDSESVDGYINETAITHWMGPLPVPEAPKELV